MSNNPKKKLLSIVVKGIAASLSAYLLALGVNSKPLTDWQFVAAILSTFSIAVLLPYIGYEWLDEEGEIENNKFIGVLYAIGVATGFLAYMAILASAYKPLAAIFVITWAVSLGVGIPFLKKPNK